MIVATVVTCSQRWRDYQRLRRNFDKLGFPFPLRTFQTGELEGNPYANHILTARAALAYADRHLPISPDSWMLYLEDDVVLHPELPGVLSRLVEIGANEQIDSWYLCNRQNPVQRQYRSEALVLNELQ